MAIFSDPSRAFAPVIKVTGYQDKEQTKKIGSVTLLYDKTTLDVSIENCVSDDNSIGGSNSATQFNKSKPSELKVTFVLDDTTFSNPVDYLMPNNMIPGNADQKIKQLKALSEPFGAENTPPFISVKSMNMPLLDTASGVFYGLLTQFKVKNELVDASGNRIKAKIECVFKHVSIKDEVSSASGFDKVATVSAGVSLATLAIASLGSVALLAPLAAANDKNSVRDKQADSSVRIPPDKEIQERAQAGKSEG